MNLTILRVAFLLSAVAMAYSAKDSEAVAHFMRHPQEQFCSADFGKSENTLSRKITICWSKICIRLES